MDQLEFWVEFYSQRLPALPIQNFKNYCKSFQISIVKLRQDILALPCLALELENDLILSL